MFEKYVNSNKINTVNKCSYVKEKMFKALKMINKYNLQLQQYFFSVKIQTCVMDWILLYKNKLDLHLTIKKYV
jgi:hypothetical protein